MNFKICCGKPTGLSLAFRQTDICKNKGKKIRLSSDFSKATIYAGSE